MGWMVRDQYQAGARIFLYSTASALALQPTQPPMQWALGVVSPETKQPRHDADHSPLSCVEIKNGGVIPLLPHTSSWSGS
jgi:hypothetical protein